MKNQERERRRIERLLEKASKYVQQLNEIAKSRPELLVPIARKLIKWPGFISPKHAFQKQNDELINEIQLGVDSPFSPKRWRPSAPTTQMAIDIYKLCCTYEKQWQLPPLTKETKRLWFDRGWDYRVNVLGIVPEKDPVLARLGKSAARERSGLDNKSVLAAKYRGRACDVRAEIKRQVWNTFNRMLSNKSLRGFESSTKFKGTLRLKLIKAKKSMGD
jgi:hypothetical protein